MSILGLLVVLAAVGVTGLAAVVATVVLLKRATPPALPMKEHDVLRASLEDVRKGGLLHVRNMGDDFEDVDFEVERFDRYAAGRDEWHLIEGTYKNRPIALEWQKVRGTLRAWEHKRLRALTAEQVGLGGAALDGLAVGKTHEHEGTTFSVEVAGKALRHEGGTGFGKEHHAWRLVSQDGKKVLNVERWGEKPAVASLGEAVDPAMVEIYKVRA